MITKLINLLKSSWFVGILVLATRVVRVLPANFSPLGSFGFFSKNFVSFALVIVFFDIFVGGLYQGFVFTYLGFLAYAVFGWISRNKFDSTWQSQALLLPVASFSFFLLSNLGVWWYWYPRDVSGLITCLTFALPFYQNTLLGDLSFGYSYLVVKNKGKVSQNLASINKYFKLYFLSKSAQ